jgi:hypothetical protein
MELSALLDQYDVVVQSKLNDHGLVRIGEFESRQAAAQFVEAARETPGIRIPGYNPIWPPDAEPCMVDIFIGSNHALFPRHDRVM